MIYIILLYTAKNDASVTNRTNTKQTNINLTAVCFLQKYVALCLFFQF